MNRVVATVIVAIAAVAAATPAIAQNLGAPSETPRAEVAVFTGTWNIEPPGPIGVGGRLTMNRTEALGAEISLEARRRDTYGPAAGMMLVNARLVATDQARSKSGMFTAGVALGVGTRRRLAPMVGLGMQTLWGVGLVAGRADVQFFPGGAVSQRNNLRLVLSGVVALR